MPFTPYSFIYKALALQQLHLDIENCDVGQQQLPIRYGRDPEHVNVAHGSVITGADLHLYLVVPQAVQESLTPKLQLVKEYPGHSVEYVQVWHLDEQSE